MQAATCTQAMTSIASVMLYRHAPQRAAGAMLHRHQPPQADEIRSRGAAPSSSPLLTALKGVDPCLYQQAAAGPPEAAAASSPYWSPFWGASWAVSAPAPAAKSVAWLRGYMLQSLVRLTIRDRSRLPVRPGSESASWRELRRMRWQSMPRYLYSTRSQLTPVSKLNARSTSWTCAEASKSTTDRKDSAEGQQQPGVRHITPSL